jgi:hypothetical protein
MYTIVVQTCSTVKPKLSLTENGHPLDVIIACKYDNEQVSSELEQVTFYINAWASLLCAVSAVKNTFHFVRGLTGPGQEISCANASNPPGRPKNRAKTGTFLHRWCCIRSLYLVMPKVPDGPAQTR